MIEPSPSSSLKNEVILEQYVVTEEISSIMKIKFEELAQIIQHINYEYQNHKILNYLRSIARRCF